MSDVSSGHGEGPELPTGDELRAAREMRRRARIKIAIQAKHDGNPLYRERVRTALSKHWDGNGKRLTGVWALRDRVRELERGLERVRELADPTSAPHDALDHIGRVASQYLGDRQPVADAVVRPVRWIDD